MKYTFENAPRDKTLFYEHMMQMKKELQQIHDLKINDVFVLNESQRNIIKEILGK